MRYREFELTEDELFELNMSPGNLKNMVKNIDARAGMEFELIVPGVEDGDNEDDYDSEPDYDADESFPTGRGFRREVMDFFVGGDYGNSRSTVQRELDRLDEEYFDWKSNQFDDWLGNNSDMLVNTVRGQMSQQDDESDEQFEQRVQDTIASGGDEYDAAMQEMQDEFDNEDQFDDFLGDEGISTMLDFGNRYNLDWPYVAYRDNSSSGGADIDSIADDFGQAIGRPVNAATRYHGGRREAGHYVVEPDGSLQGDDGETGLEFVSPVLPIPEMLSDLDKVAKWAAGAGAYTNDSTGLHINVSVPDQTNLDYVKLAMFLGDDYILEQFGRVGNSYAKSALKKIKATAASNPDRVAEMMRQFQGGLNQLASKMIHTGSTEKFTSINNRDGWIEFRGPGGDWLGEYAAGENKVTNTLLRAVVALDVATKPEAFKQEYYKKLYKTLNPKGDDDSIQYFARYAAGELPKSAMMSFVRQIQQKRQDKKEPRAAEVDATAAQSHPEGRGRPHDPNGRYAIVSREDPAAYQTGRGTEPEYLFRFNMSDPAEQHNGRYILAAWAARNGVDPANYMVVDAERWNTPAQSQQQYQVTYTINNGGLPRGMRVSAANANAAMQQVRAEIEQQGLEIDSISADPVAGGTTTAQQPAQGTGSLPPGNARWLVLDRNDNEVYSFVNTTAQSDANQYARNWMINTAPAEIRNRGPFTIVPAR